MTPQLMQSIKLLQMTTVELQQFLEQEIERNPLLERAEDDVADDTALPSPLLAPEAPQSNDAFPDAASLSETYDSSLENIYPDDPGRQDILSPDLMMQWRSSAGNGYNSSDDNDIAQYAESVLTLRDHIHEQCIFLFKGLHARMIAADLSEQLDERGYFCGTVNDTAQRLGVAISNVQDTLNILQQNIEPAGIFCTDLTECLKLQLQRRNRFDPAIATLIGNLPLLAKRDFHSLKNICHVNESDLIEMIAEIRALDPKPGRAFNNDLSDTIIADIDIHRLPDGNFSIELNSATLPKILVNNHYVTSTHVTKQEKAYFSQCLQDANWLLRALDQRATTLLKVTQEIIRHQKDFFDHGLRALKPLTLANIADAVGMHESTISRVTANKYLNTPRGVFEMRFFFSAALAASTGGEAHSAQAVRFKINELIAAETVDNILSDDMLVTLLRNDGIEIARRTVAKYREAMNIASSVTRRREKKLQQHSAHTA